MKFLKTAIKLILVGIIFFVLSRSLFTNWNQVEKLHLSFNYLYCFLSFVAVMLGWFTNVWAWRKIVVGLDHRVSFKDAFFIFFRSSLGKYLPGNIWQVVGSGYYAVNKGVPEGPAIAASLIIQVYSVIAGVVLFAAAILTGLIGRSWPISPLIKWMAVPLILFLFAVAFRPGLGQPILNRILRLFKRQEVQIKLGIGFAVTLFLVLLAGCFLSGFGIWIFANALIPTGIGLFISLSAVLAVAAIVGFLALFAPAGLGVREGVVAFFLASIPAFVAPLPAAIAMGYRVVIIISELIAFGLTWVVK